MQPTMQLPPPNEFLRDEDRVPIENMLKKQKVYNRYITYHLERQPMLLTFMAMRLFAGAHNREIHLQVADNGHFVIFPEQKYAPRLVKLVSLN